MEARVSRMHAAPVVRLPAVLEPPSQRLKAAAAVACERTIECLGLSALAAANVFQRDALLAAQFELNRKAPLLLLTFGKTLDERLVREVRPSGVADAQSPASWDSLSLVDDHEVEAQVVAERFGLEISQGCDWELRELDGYVSGLLAAAGARRHGLDRNPLRPETIGYAMIRAIESTSERPEVRKVLESELARSWAATMSQTYAGLIADLRGSGIQAARMGVRQTDRPQHDAGRSRPGEFDGSGSHLPRRAPDFSDSQRQAPFRSSGRGTGAGLASASGFGRATRAEVANAYGHRRAPMGQVDAELMALMRRLTSSDAYKAGETGAFDSGPDSFEEVTEEGLRLAAPNVIRAHREELRQASGGALDHMVIDVVGSLFDQILSDPKVPPQLARQIGRLQLPVLRTALGDPSFFSSRKHPVRRFINRIASLATALDDLDDERGRKFLKLVRELVQGIVDGDFDQADVYEHKLAELERFVAEQAQEEVAEQGDAVALLAHKEGEIRVQQRYAEQLQGGLQPLSVPDFVRDFLADVWSQVLLKATRQDGSDSPRAARMRHAGRALFMSVQPKGTSAQRKDFLVQLPKLMQEINEGMNLIGWPETAKKTFFGLLLPAHAQSLKGEGLRTLDFNLLAREVDQVFEQPVPSPADLSPVGDPSMIHEDAILPAFTAEEAQQIGLLSEGAVDWNAQVDVDLTAEAPVTEGDIAIAGMPQPEAVEPTQGRSLADHVQIGFAYQMHIDGQWQKVRLTHVSPGRTFFVFTRGKRHKQAISLTQRMLVRLCDGNRLRAFESAYLLERATARARRQLATIRPSAALH